MIQERFRYGSETVQVRYGRVATLGALRCCHQVEILTVFTHPTKHYVIASFPDDVYYFGGQLGHNVKAIHEHPADASRGEIELKVGDEIGKL